MTDETFEKAWSLRREIDNVEKLIANIDKGLEVEIRFSNGYCCGCSNQSQLLDEAEVEEFTNNINSTLRARAEARLKELQEEYNNL